MPDCLHVRSTDHNTTISIRVCAAQVAAPSCSQRTVMICSALSLTFKLLLFSLPSRKSAIFSASRCPARTVAEQQKFKRQIKPVRVRSNRSAGDPPRRQKGEELTCDLLHEVDGHGSIVKARGLGQRLAVHGFLLRCRGFVVEPKWATRPLLSPHVQQTLLFDTIVTN